MNGTASGVSPQARQPDHIPFLRLLGVHDGMDKSLVSGTDEIRGAIAMHHHEGEVR